MSKAQAKISKTNSVKKPPGPTASRVTKADATETGGGKAVKSNFEKSSKINQKISTRNARTDRGTHSETDNDGRPMEEIEQIILYDVCEDDEYNITEEEMGPSLMAPIQHYDLDDFKIKGLDGKALFPKAVHQIGGKVEVQEFKDGQPSILVTGFGMRNLKSLQDLLAAEEQKRLLELYRRQQELEAMEGESSSTTTTSTKPTEKSSETSTEKERIEIKALEYLMGLEKQEPEEYVSFEPVPEEKEDFVYSSSLSMRRAQKYLRVHRIFDFFQYIIAHLLCATPNNPIEFILELLNKCLLYRSGAGEPPTLYSRKHFDQLFFLMDRMNTGYIELEQYKQGMKTFGICEYNQTPAMTSEGISKETFMEEATEAQLAMFEDLIRKKVVGRTPRPCEFRPISYELQKVEEKKSTFFMPDDLFKSYKKDKMKDIKEEGEMDENWNDK